MKIRWLLQACIVLAIGVGLVSCSKAEIEQAMNRPAEIMLQSSPCQPAGIASTATPEFCVNVMELQLLSRDTQADVSLTLVNRTGRRVFLSLSSSPYLTDSNGSRWERHSVTGIGFRSPRNVPVPLEPNVETQISILFTNKGQAPSEGTTFSMRGEIAIMKVDMRGQASPLDVVVNRGFNVSGMRLPQQPPQSSAPREQSPDSTRAQVAPQIVDPTTTKASASSKPSTPVAVAGAADSGKPNSPKPAVSSVSGSSNQKAGTIDTPAGDTPTSNSGSKSTGRGGSGPDVIGFRIGMTPNQARENFKSHGFESSIKTLATHLNGYQEVSKTLEFSLPGHATQPVPNTNYVAWIGGIINERKSPVAENSSNQLIVVFGPVPRQEEIIWLGRDVSIPASKRPTADAFEKTMLEKYGTPTEKASPQTYLWVYDSNGMLRKPTSSTRKSFVTCPVGDTEAWYLGYYFNRMQEFKQILGDKTSHPDGCGTILIRVNLVFEGGAYTPGALVNNYSIRMAGFDAATSAFDANKSMVDKAQADASGELIKKGEQQKPDF